MLSFDVIKDDDDNTPRADSSVTFSPIFTGMGLGCAVDRRENTEVIALLISCCVPGGSWTGGCETCVRVLAASSADVRNVAGGVSTVTITFSNKKR